MKRVECLLLTIVLSLVSTSLQAEEPMALQSVMKDLGKHMQTIAGAISVEDWALVATTAPLIASHPQTPLAEKARIIRFMGSNMGKFKAYDMETHEAAHEMEHAAHEQNGQQVIAAYHKVQSSCLSCHQTFRASFVEYFYGKK